MSTKVLNPKREVFVSDSGVTFQYFTNKCTQESLQQSLSSDLVGLAREVKSHLAR